MILLNFTAVLPTVSCTVGALLSDVTVDGNKADTAEMV